MSRKIIHWFTALVLFAALAQPIGVHAVDLTAEEKYQRLVEQGIFEGFPDGQAHLDQNTTRAQAAKIVTLILGLDPNALASGTYTDLAAAEWAAGYIGALTAAGIMQGKGDGIFDPSANVTKEQLATIMVRALNLEVSVAGDDFTGDVSDWAKNYVNTALEAGLISPSDDYTQPVTREMLVEASYYGYNMVQEQQAQPGIQSAEQSGVRLVTIRLKGQIDPDAASIVIERIGEDGDRVSVGIDALEWSGDGDSVTAVLNEDAEAGTYEVTLTVDQSGEKAAFSERYEVMPETLTKVELGGADRLPRADDVEVPFYLYNQYGEPMSARPSNISVTDSLSPKATELHPERNVVLVDLAGRKAGEMFSISLLLDNRFPAIRTYEIGEEPVIRSIETDGFVDESGTPVESLNKGESAYLLLRAYDQFGNVITNLRWLQENLRAEESAEYRLNLPKQLTQRPDGTIAVRVTAGSYWRDTSITVIVRSVSGGASVQASIAVKSDPSYFTPISPPAPSATVAVDPESVVTVTGATYLTVTSTNVVNLYYALLYEHDTNVPTAEDLLKVETSRPIGAIDYGKVTTGGQLRLGLNTSLDQKYKLYLVGSNAGGSLVSNLLVVDIDTDSDNVFNLVQLVDNSDEMYLIISLIHTPRDAQGTVYAIVSEQPITDISSPDDVVQYVYSGNVPNDIVFRSIETWTGISDQIFAGVNDGKLYHAYVVLEYRGIRQMVQGTLNDF